MSNITTVQVRHAGGEYPVMLGSGFLQKSNNLREADKKLLRKQMAGKGATVVVSNETVWEKYQIGIERIFVNDEAPWRDPIVLPDKGEEGKNWQTVEFILNTLAKRRIHRDGTVVAVGGGVIGDVAGFAAAIYMRGIRLVQVPTTLLAQVDAAIGGKTGVNSRHGKNLFGVFHQPAAVLCDTEFLTTLAEKEYNSGLAEVVKYALLGDVEFFVWLEQNADSLLARKSAALTYAVKKSVQAKAAIIAADERETNGQRALLNLGHTFAHALENIAGYGYWRHGEAVAAGLVAAARLSEKLLGFAAEDTARIETLLKRLQLPVRFAPSAQETTDENRQQLPERFLEVMRIDKKHTNSTDQFILMKSLGQAKLEAVTDIEAVKQVIKEML